MQDFLWNFKYEKLDLVEYSWFSFRFALLKKLLFFFSALELDMLVIEGSSDL